MPVTLIDQKCKGIAYINLYQLISGLVVDQHFAKIAEAHLNLRH